MRVLTIQRRAYCSVRLPQEDASGYADAREAVFCFISFHNKSQRSGILSLLASRMKNSPATTPEWRARSVRSLALDGKNCPASATM